MIKPEFVKEGCLISVELTPRTVPCNCYIGLAKSVDKYGVKMNPVEWDKLRGIRLSNDNIHIPWMSINSMLVCTS